MSEWLIMGHMSKDGDINYFKRVQHIFILKRIYIIN